MNRDAATLYGGISTHMPLILEEYDHHENLFYHLSTPLDRMQVALVMVERRLEWGYYSSDSAYEEWAQELLEDGDAVEAWRLLRARSSIDDEGYITHRAGDLWGGNKPEHIVLHETLHRLRDPVVVSDTPDAAELAPGFECSVRTEGDKWVLSPLGVINGLLAQKGKTLNLVVDDDGCLVDAVIAEGAFTMAEVGGND